MANKKTQYTLTPTDPPPGYEESPKPPLKPPGPLLRAPLPLDIPALNSLRGKRIGLTNIEVIPSHYPEDLPKTSTTPFEYVLQTATQKAIQVYRQEINNAAKGEPALILAADTIVVSHAGEILEKPRNEKDHIAMLTLLRNWPVHKVYTAVAAMTPLESAVTPGYALETRVEETVVYFDKTVTDELILAYVRTREGVDKAGGYGIQGIGSILIERIEGTYDNVVGLPLRATLRCIEKVLAQGEEDGGGLEYEDE